MPQPLKPGTAEIVKATIPALEIHGVAIATTMYGTLMQDPAIAALFNQTDQANGRQPHALAAAVLAYARHIDHPEKLDAALSLIVERHVAVMIEPGHYPVVGKALLEAIRTVLGSAATEEILDAWGDAYRFLADVLIAREATLYEQRATATGGWRGWRRFRVSSRVEECADIVSFWLTPADGKPILRHDPGQFLTFRLTQDGFNTRRSYSISSAPADDSYRVTIKRVPDGKISNWFHDHVQEGALLDVAPPAGDFTLARAKGAPVLLVGAGIGVTPFISMLLAENDANSAHRLSLVHAAHDFHDRPFLSTLSALNQEAYGSRIRLFGSEGKETTNLAPLATQTGRVSAHWLSTQIDDETHIFLCGPSSFQHDLIGGLKALGVSENRLHHEFFGSSEPLRD
ncbi:globin domain-containing protein [Asaia astilbis]